MKALEITNLRLATAMAKGAGNTGTAGAILKLKGSELQHTTTEALLDVTGPHIYPFQPELVRGEAAEPIGPDWACTGAPNYIIARAATIYGGTSEVQKNILAKSVLGL